MLAKILGELVPSRSVRPPDPSSQGRSTPLLPHQTSTHHQTGLLPPTTRSSTEGGPRGSRSGPLGTGRDRTGHGLGLPRVLQPHLCDAQERSRQVAADYQSHPPERVPGQLPIQDGNGHYHPNSHPTRAVGHLSRLEIRILTSPSPPEFQEVPTIHPPRQGLPTQDLSLRASLFPSTLHRICVGFGAPPQGTGHSVPCLPRRLASERTGPRDSLPTHRGGPTRLPRSGDEGELGEVNADPQTGLRVCRSLLPTGGGPGQTTSGTDSQDGRSPPSPTGPRVPSSGTMAILDRDHVLHDAADPDGTTLPKTPTMASSGFLGVAHGSTHCLRPADARPCSTPPLVAPKGQHIQGRPPTPLPGVKEALHGRQRYRVGSPPGEPTQRSPGHLVPRHTPPQGHQLERIEDSGSSPASLPLRCPQSDNLAGHRQHHGSGLHQQPGGDQIKIPDGSSVGVVPVVPSPQLPVTSTTHPGEAQCARGPTEQRPPSHLDRMVALALGDGENLVEVGETLDRPFRYQTQHQTPPLRVTGTGRKSLAGGCSLNRLDTHVGLCLPSKPTPSSTSTKNVERALHHSVDRSVQTGETLVSPSITTSHRSTLAAPQQRGSPVSTTHRDPPPEPRESRPSRVEIIERANRDQGFSASVAQKSATARRPSTLKVYDGKWKAFTEWAKDHDCDPSTATPQQVADFLDYLFSGPKQLAASTIAGYRASISKVLQKTTGLDVGQDQTISDLMTFFKRNRPRATNQVPQWDLILVLRMLKSSPFEPISSASLKWVTWKTAFLLLLAMGGRRGEVHALDSSNIKVLGNWDSVILNPDPSFQAKNCDPGTGKRTLRDIHIQSLKEVSGKDKDMDYDLCPVRSLRSYLNLTKCRRGMIKHLFVTYKEGPVKRASANTISSWVKQLIKFAYQKGQSDENVLRLHRTSVHEIRAIASSLALYQNVSLEDILSNCRWSSSTTFTSHYLRDMTDTTQRIHELLPLSVAGKTLQRRKHRRK